MRKIFLITCLLALTACYRPWTSAYRQFYHHLTLSYPQHSPMQESDYFLVLLVDARHLDYTDTRSFFKTVAKHPSDGSKNGDVGHAWIYLKGIVNGQEFVLEGGQSGERGVLQAKYFDGIMNYNEWGIANPTLENKQNACYEPNPIKYLWTVQKDGFFQKGSGDHVPTFAAKIDLTEQQFQQILKAIHPHQYAYEHYSLIQQQCCSFVAQVAALAGLHLDYLVTMSIQSRVWFRGCWIRFWEDPDYAQITFASPDILEKSLQQSVREGRAEYALDWYLSRTRCL